MKTLRRILGVAALVVLVALSLALVAGCYQDSTSRARDLAASMNEYAPGESYPGKPHWEQPERYRSCAPSK
jgi:hypothetical protein